MTPDIDPDHLHFALSLEHALAETGVSHVWSPHSAGTALTLLAEGSSGKVREALARALTARGGSLAGHVAALDATVGAGPDALDEGARTPDDDPDGPPSLDLVSVNDLYVRQGGAVLPGFASALAARPGSAVRSADFAAAPERARADINTAVADVTRGMITDLIPRGTITSETESILVNALWVRLMWLEPFEAAATRERVFHTPDGDRSVPTMWRSGHARVAEADGLRLLTLSGRHGLDLDIVLSEEGGTEPPALTLESHRTLREAARSETVNVALPRFRVESGFELLEALPDLAAVAGRPTRDLSGITGDPLRLDAIVHRAVLSVDEIGAEGAAATAVFAVAAAMPLAPPVEFVVDRPFAFVLRRGASVLFLGRITDPEDPGPAGSSDRGR
ncbi:serpin family protein [Nocardiopsis lambiniae]|uniref:Serpin family protein n=1 Tax=Nocardiopsis lambiniae TaxID=3075539 RepID=A0ABU2MAA8_9ACTN|nr:serpin family protein [Nocardiopsis sp. DSM 44743]MDT0329611.1 serpin family protein [Nocardiopsis sp. DSM 44743]